MKRTEISTLGEFGLINHLTKDIKLENASSLYGVGDDCAVLHYPNGRTLVTSDMLMEGIHFDLVYTPLKHLGYKAAMVNFSDIYAMNGQPRQLIVNIAVGKRCSVEDLEDLYAGLRLACEKHHVDIVGGDTSSSVTGLALSLTCIGEAAEEDIVYRNGAKDTDLICVAATWEQPTWACSSWNAKSKCSTPALPSKPRLPSPTLADANICWSVS